MFSLFRKEPPPFVSAVIVSAGSSSRMEGVDKQWLELGGVPVISRAIGAFQDCEAITEIVVVTREESVPGLYALIQDNDFTKVASVVSGGKTRQHSVQNGVKACSSETAFIAIHDGARPLVEESVIQACLEKAVQCGGAAAGVPVKDTVKVCDKDQKVLSTPARESLFSIQTPQIFEAKAFRQALQMASASGYVFTDDCQLMEKAGKAVFITPGSYSNIKITTPEDVAMAEALLYFQREGAIGWTL